MTTSRKSMGSAVDGLEHVVREQPVEEVLLGVRGVVGGVPADEALVDRLALRALDDGALLHLPAVAVDEGVGEDLEEPGLDVGAALELVEEAVGPHAGVLHEVLGVALVLGQPEGRRVERVEVGQRQLLELLLGAVGCGESPA